MSTSTPKPHEIPQDYADALHAYQCAIASHEETLSELAALRAENNDLRRTLRLRTEEAEQLMRDGAKAREALAAAERERDEARTKLRKWPSIECPCCGEEAALARYFLDGDPTTCGCGGIVSCDGESCSIIMPDDECPKCAARAEEQR